MRARIASWLAFGVALSFAGVTHGTSFFIAQGTGIQISVRDCRSTPALTLPDRCIGTGPGILSGTLVQSIEVAGPDFSTQSAHATDPRGIVGTDATGATLDTQGPGSLTPGMAFGAFSPLPYTRDFVLGNAIQGYAWDGTGPAQRTLSATLDFTATDLNNLDDPDASADPLAGATVGLAIFSLTSPGFEVSDDPSTFQTGCYLAQFDPVTCLGARADFQNLGGGFVETQLSSTSPLLLSASFVMEPGRYYFVDLEGQALARFGATFDASHTLTTQFDTLQGLVPLRAAPEPASAALLVLALMLLRAARRFPSAS